MLDQERDSVLLDSEGCSGRKLSEITFNPGEVLSNRDDIMLETTFEYIIHTGIPM